VFENVYRGIAAMLAQHRLFNRRALVTGAARGIGLEVARRLLREGARVAVADVDQTQLEAAKVSLGAVEPDTLLLVRCDVGNQASVRDLSENIDEEFGGLDILINNAAILDWTAIEDLTSARLQEILNVNLAGAINCIQAFVAALSRSASARIVNIASINGLRGTSSSIAYNASKAALINLTQCLAVDLAPRGILVNAVAPGFVDTRMSKLPDGSSEYGTDLFKDVYIKYRKILLGRPGQPEDIAGPVIFLSSDDARYVTGQVLVVDGGVTASF
jgi:NAD(P)-dependent dehydrogenase (short-subunit alcohol dehydrogenase family)